MPEVTIFEFDLTDAQFNAPFAGSSDTDTTDSTETAGGDDSRSSLPFVVLVGLIVAAYLVRRWRTDGGTDIEVASVEVDPESETESV
ncbi:MAG: hypothetical protein ABEH65_11405 [Halobacteriales archaeon]